MLPRPTARLLLSLFAVIMLTACSGARRDSKIELLLISYESTIRWGDFDSAWEVVDPKYREKNPQSSTDWERYKQIRVAGYRTDGPNAIDDNTVGQVVEVEVINVHTQVPRTIVDKQIWKWDEEAERWWLTTGLPDITRR